jgi:hypothetical protein
MMGRILIGGFAMLSAMTLAASPSLAQDQAITVTGQAQSKWKEAESDHFKIYSDGDEKSLARLSGRLEAIHYLLKIATNMREPDDANIVKVKVYSVASVADVQRLLGDPSADAAGYYDPQLAGPISVIPRDAGNSGTFSGELVLFHEYAHHFMLQYQAAAYPAWYVEGFAELISTASFEREGAITYGKPARHREGELRYTRRYPAAKMVDGRYLDESRDAENWDYGDAWAVTHYLTFSEKRKGQLKAYLSAINAGQEYPEAAKIFGDVNDLTREVGIYVDSGSYPYKTPPLPPEVIKAPVIRPITLAEADFIDDRITMERLARISTKDEYEAWVKVRAETEYPVKKDFDTYYREKTTSRDKWMQKLRSKTAAYAGNSLAWTVQAHAECMAKDFAACQMSSDKALALQPDNWEAMLRKGQALLGLADTAADADKKAVFKDARAWLLKANAANPPAHEPLYFYHQSFGAEGKRAPEVAVAGLAQVVDTIPQIDAPRLTLGSELMARARFAEARRTLRPLAYSPHESVEQKKALALLKLIDEKEAKDSATDSPAS